MSLLSVSLRICRCPLGLARDALRAEFWRLIGSTRGFLKAKGRTVTLRYDERLEQTMDPGQYLSFCDDAIVRLGERFEFSLPSRPVIYLFRGAMHINRIIRGPLTANIQGYAFAFFHRETVLIRADCEGATLEEVTRHECVHLFSKYLRRTAPPLNFEGLATHMQPTQEDKAIDFYALLAFLKGYGVPLRMLIHSSEFYGQTRSWAYAMAGSFTGYLIDRFGWNTYRTFYRLADSGNYDRVFVEVYGITLNAAESRWRAALMIKWPAFDTELRRISPERWLRAAKELNSN